MTSTCGRTANGGYIPGIWAEFKRAGAAARECVNIDTTDPGMSVHNYFTICPTPTPGGK
jgi:hypothetical protein